jgi:hypothetical protein
MRGPFLRSAMQCVRLRGPCHLQGLDVRRLLALRARLHFEGNALVFLERLETFAANFREVSKQVVTAGVRYRFPYSSFPQDL